MSDIQTRRVWIPRSGVVLCAADELQAVFSAYEFEKETFREAYLNVFERKLVGLIASQISVEEVSDEAEKLEEKK